MIGSKRNTSTRLRHRLTLQQEVQTADGAGGYIRSWQNITDLWAEISQVSGRSIYGSEKLQYGKIQSGITHKITIRYRSGISTAMRLLFENRAFNIRAVTNIRENDEILELLVEEGVAG